MLQNATTLAIVAVHSADNEPPSVSKMWTFGHSPRSSSAKMKNATSDMALIDVYSLVP